VFTDGDDTESHLSSLGKVIDRARIDEVMIYAIGLESRYFDGQRMVRSRPDSGLRKVADETGGGYFELTKAADLSSTFTRVRSGTAQPYVIGFTPMLLDGQDPQAVGPHETARHDRSGPPPVTSRHLTSRHRDGSFRSGFPRQERRGAAGSAPRTVAACDQEGFEIEFSDGTLNCCSTSRPRQDSS